MSISLQIQGKPVQIIVHCGLERESLTPAKMKKMKNTIFKCKDYFITIKKTTRNINSKTHGFLNGKSRPFGTASSNFKRNT
jgi:hypothetical protein